MNEDRTYDERFVCKNCTEFVPAERVAFGENGEIVTVDCPHCETTMLEVTLIGRIAQVVEGEKHVDEVLPGLSDVDDSTPDEIVYVDEEGNEKLVNLDLEDTGETLDEWCTGSAETCDLPGCPETEDLEEVEGFGALQEVCTTHADDLRGLSRYKMTENGLRLRDDAERTGEEQEKIERFRESWENRDEEVENPIPPMDDEEKA